jgi:hypothetical protein
LVTAPPFLDIAISSNGKKYLMGTPGVSDLGAHEVVLRLNDGTDSVDQSFTLAVSDIEYRLTTRTELRYPSYGADEIPNDTRFSWDRLNGADEYQLQVTRATDSQFAHTLFDRTFAYGTSASNTVVNYMVFNLPEESELIWRVRAQNGSGTSPWSTTASYTTMGGTSTPVEEGAELPTQAELFQNYPNPFNPTTTIAFELPARSDVTLTVYDVMGRQVTTLVSESLSAGRHDVTWDAGDRASGLYLYRLRAGNFVQSKTLTLVK